MKKYKILLLSILCLVMTLVNCDFSSGDSEDDPQPIYTIKLNDGGEVNFFEDEPGLLITSVTSKSLETVQRIGTKNCIEIFQEFGNGDVPQILQEAYERSLQNTVNAEDDEETSEEMQDEGQNDELQDDSTASLSTKADKNVAHFYNPNWSFTTFRNYARYAAGLTYYMHKDTGQLNNKSNDWKLTEYSYLTGDARLERHTSVVHAFAYCYRGKIVFRMKQAKGEFKRGKWVSRGYGKVNQGRWCHIYASGASFFSCKRWFRIYVQEAKGDGFHLICYKKK